MRTKVMIAFLGLMSFSVIGFAQANNPNASTAQNTCHRQGRISQKEANFLRREHRQLQQARGMARADGRVTPKEHARLKYMQHKSYHHMRRAWNTPVRNN
jgi:erythromycin esterase-like protein